MLKLTGDFRALGSLINRINDPGHVLRSASLAMAEEVIDLVKDEHRTETDPYGDPWPDKQRPDGRKVMSGKTSDMKGGVHRERADAQGFEVADSVNYGPPHQTPKRGPDGRLKRPKRLRYPEKERGLPETWQDRLAGAGMEAIRAAYGK